MREKSNMLINFKKAIITVILSFVLLSNSYSQQQIRIETKEYNVVLYKTLDLSTNQSTTQTITTDASLTIRPSVVNSILVSFSSSTGKQHFLCKLVSTLNDGDDFVEKYEVNDEPDGVEGVIFYATNPGIEDDVNYDMALIMPDQSKNVLHQIFIVKELVPDFNKTIVSTPIENNIWEQLESSITTIFKASGLVSLKQDKKDGYTESWTIKTDDITGLNKSVNFYFSEISSSFTNELTHFINYNIYNLKTWITADRSIAQQESDILKWEQMIDKVVGDKMVKFYNPYNEETFGTMGASLGMDKSILTNERKHILDEVYWVDPSEKDNGILNLKAFHISLKTELKGYNKDQYKLSISCTEIVEK